MRCAIDPHPIRKVILDSHTLIASVTLPVDLFHPIGVVTCGLVFEAHQPHAESPSPTWFGSWKNDGFEKQKRRGRIDPNHHWPSVRDAWLKSFHARATVPGQSISRHVDTNDEWCAEAYMDTDYSALMQSEFERSVRHYAMYRLHGNPSNGPIQHLDTSTWKSFALSDLFEIKKGARLIKSAMKPGPLAFISAIETNNGLRQRVTGEAKHPAGVVTVNYNGNGVAEAFYQPEPFWASDDVNVLYPKAPLDPQAALFICTIIRQEKYRFSYGRKWSLERMKGSQIKLPVDSGGNPDWAFMKQFVSGLPFGSQLS
jgi:type I restriction enzyme M protein